MQITVVCLIASTSPAGRGALVSSKTCERAGADSRMPQLTWLVCNMMGYVGLFAQHQLQAACTVNDHTF